MNATKLKLLLAVAKPAMPQTSRQIAQRMEIHYERNFNKREARYAKRFGRGFFVRRRLTDAETKRWPNASTKVNHWFLADERVRGCSKEVILDAYDAFCRRKPRQRTAGPRVKGLLPASTQDRA
jgi:hypothetical protein